MTLTQLYEKTTGVENPRFITAREESLAKQCLVIINPLEEDIEFHKGVQEQSDNLFLSFEKYCREEKKQGSNAPDWLLLKQWKEKEPK